MRKMIFTNLKLYLLLMIYFIREDSVHCVKYSSLSHCNYTIDRIDAITNFTNGSLFVASGQNYWILGPNELPIHENARNLKEYLPDFTNVDAVTNIKIKIDRENRKCVISNEQIVFYSQDVNNSTIISTYENQKWNRNQKPENIEILSAAKSIDWSQPIDAITYFENIVAIFQGDSYTSVRCQDGYWTEVRHISISSSFNDVKGPIDSADIISTGNPLDDAYLYMFQSESFYVCAIFGNEPCNGPLSIVHDFFKFDKECGFNVEESSLSWIIVVIIILILMIILLAFICYLLVLRSRQITFWVNRRRSKDANVQLTYEALNGQTDAPTKGIEAKGHMKNGSGLEPNSEDQSNKPFIDKESSAKDEEANHQ